MRRRFECALDECLSQLNTNEFSLDTVLARYPEYEAELRPLLRTAMLIHQTPRPVPSQEAKATARRRLLAAAEKRREEARDRPVLGRRLEQGAVLLVQPLLGRRARSLRLAQAMAALLVVVSLVGAGTLRVAARSLPDSPVYPVKLTTEQVQLALTTTAAGKARLHMSYSARRLEEARTLWEAGKGLSEAALQAIESENGSALTAICKASEEERLDLLSAFALVTNRQRETLEEIRVVVPPPEQEPVEEAIEVSEKHRSIAKMSVAMVAGASATSRTPSISPLTCS